MDDSSISNTSMEIKYVECYFQKMYLNSPHKQTDVTMLGKRFLFLIFFMWMDGELAGHLKKYFSIFFLERNKVSKVDLYRCYYIF